MRLAAPDQFIWWSNGELGEGIHKPIQWYVVVEVKWKLHCQVVATHVSTEALEVEEKEELENLLKEFVKFVADKPGAWFAQAETKNCPRVKS